MSLFPFSKREENRRLYSFPVPFLIISCFPPSLSLPPLPCSSHSPSLPLPLPALCTSSSPFLCTPSLPPLCTTSSPFPLYLLLSLPSLPRPFPPLSSSFPSSQSISSLGLHGSLNSFLHSCFPLVPPPRFSSAVFVFSCP